MRYLRLFSVLFFLTFTITGCHRKREQAVPPPQAQAPIVSTLPPVPPLTFPNVELGQPKSKPPAAPPSASPKPRKTIPVHQRRHLKPHKREPDTTAASSGTSATDKPQTPTPPPARASSAAVLGQLSTDDATANPVQKAEIKQVIQSTQNSLKKLSNDQRTKRKDDIAQVKSFLQQAEQAWNMNDLVGAQTLANKAKILIDEILK